MNNLIILNIQAFMCLTAMLVIYFTYLRPWFAAQQFGPAVLPGLLIHSFRFVGLTMLVTGQVDPKLPRSAIELMAFGDLASAVTALVAAIAVALKSKLATPLVTLFVIVGGIDFAVAIPVGLNAGVFESYIGGMWIVIEFFVPLVLLTQIYITYRLIKHFRAQKVGYASRLSFQEISLQQQMSKNVQRH